VDQEGFVFTGDRGGQIRQGNWRERVFQPTCRALGILREGRGGEKEVPRVHDLRHTAASLGASAGMSANEVKEMLGHATIGITLDLYTHLFDDDKRSSADALGAVMKGARRQGAEVIDFPDRKAE
jgi:integrase